MCAARSCTATAMGGLSHGSILGSCATGGALQTSRYWKGHGVQHRLLQVQGWFRASNVRLLACRSHTGDGPFSSRPPQETVLEALSEAAKAEGRISQRTNIVMGGTVSGSSDEEWKELNEKVNSYPTRMNFTAIGSGGNDFAQAMVEAVESVLQCPIPEDEVKLSLSSKGRYISVRIGPVAVDSSDQVQAVYRAMKRDDRMKYFL